MIFRFSILYGHSDQQYKGYSAIIFIIEIKNNAISRIQTMSNLEI